MTIHEPEAPLRTSGPPLDAHSWRRLRLLEAGFPAGAGGPDPFAAGRRGGTVTPVNPTTPELVPPPSSDEAWLGDLTDDGAAGRQAQVRLHQLLLRATRHQVWRLRDTLPGAGAGDLEDLAQQAADDALVAVLRQLPTFEGRSRFTTWAYKFGVLHAGVAVRRQAWRHREVHLPDGLTLADTSPGPEALSEGVQLARAVPAAIATELTPHQRRVVLALLVEEVPIDVLADRLGSTRNALYKTLHDARRRLRTALITSGHLVDRAHRSTP
jgi:RNA polymerase sigma-70 factor (ECF subfamily)